MKRRVFYGIAGLVLLLRAWRLPPRGQPLSV